MKIKLPSEANAIDCSRITGHLRTIVKICKKTGWEIAIAIAKLNNIEMAEFAEACDLGVYCDHIMIDTKSIA